MSRVLAARAFSEDSQSLHFKTCTMDSFLCLLLTTFTAEAGCRGFPWASCEESVHIAMSHIPVDASPKLKSKIKGRLEPTAS